jgi:hypothetical protein
MADFWSSKMGFSMAAARVVVPGMTKCLKFDRENGLGHEMKNEFGLLSVLVLNVLKGTQMAVNFPPGRL